MRVFHILTSLFVAALVSTGAASAACNAVGCDGKIDRLLAFGTGDVQVIMVDDVTPVNCTPNGLNAFTILNGTVGIDRMYAALLSAKLNQTDIFVRIDDLSNPCTVSYVDTRTP